MLAGRLLTRSPFQLYSLSSVRTTNAFHSVQRISSSAILGASLLRTYLPKAPDFSCNRIHSAVNSDMAASNPHRNRLADAKSPYLLQHASNPVDWYEWSEEAFDKAATENKPIFLSVGYSACHWCHVLSHESFEDTEIARMMNERFVNIKVDREERPDVDRLYMTLQAVFSRTLNVRLMVDSYSVQATSGRGGWPMSVWLTPELAPFFAGTYFPKVAFKGLCERIAATWNEDPDKVRQSGESVIKQLRTLFEPDPAASSAQIKMDTSLKKLFDKWKQDFDHTYAGFGEAPKFPSPSMTFYPLLRYAYYATIPAEKASALNMVMRTLLAIRRGGINDHVGRGIARYSVDAEWRLPHFEKMLYDQAQLITYALECSLLVEDSAAKVELQKMAADIIEYTANDLRSLEGAFCSAEDADSPPTPTASKKQEGAFYVWKKSEIDTILGEHAPLFEHYFGVQENGNIDPSHDAHGELKDQNQLYIRTPISEVATKYATAQDEVQRIIYTCLAKLKQYRDSHRPRPHLDDKVVTAWNGLMLSALSLASSTLPPDMALSDKTSVASKSLEMAESVARFARNHLWDASHEELCRSWREGRGPAGMCEDYAGMVSGLIDLYEATGHEDHLVFALELQKRQDELFWDDQGGGYFASPAGDRRILIRLKDSQDGAEPSALSVSVSNLYRLSYLITAEERSLKDKAERTLASQSNMLARAPHALGMMVAAGQMGPRGLKQIIVTGTPGHKETDEVLRSINSRFVPNRSLILINPAALPSTLPKYNEVVRSLVDGLAGKTATSSTPPEVRICEGGVCGLPVRGEELEKLLGSL